MIDKRIEVLLLSIEMEYADAKTQCGGDGKGCETYRKYYNLPQRRWHKCASCPMENIADLASQVGIIRREENIKHAETEAKT